MVVLILNGAPRSGKSSIAAAVQEASPTPWVNLGVDLVMAGTPANLRPGIGLRPGGERPDLEPFVKRGYRALFDSLAGHHRAGIDVVADVGVHDDHSKPLAIWAEAAQLLGGVPTYVVGVRCSLTAILDRRAATSSPEAPYATATGDHVPEPVLRWQEAVHRPGRYDLEVDTSERSPEDCAMEILELMARRPPSALAGMGHAD